MYGINMQSKVWCSEYLVLMANFNSKMMFSHGGEEGCSGDKKLIIDMSYIFEKVMKNAIQIH